MKEIIFSGTTTEVDGHVHNFFVYSDHSVYVEEAAHPQFPDIKHTHSFNGKLPYGTVNESKSSCYPNCLKVYGAAGVGYHTHELDVLSSTAKAKGANGLKAKDIFFYRGLYKVGLYPEDVVEPVDTWYKKPYYGKIDRDMNSVHVIDKNLTSVLLPYGKTTIMGLNFVVRAYEAFESEFKQKIGNGTLTPPPGLDPLVVKTGYINPRSLYIDHIEGFKKFLIGNYIKKKRNKIKNFEDFMKELVLLMKKVGHKYPILFSSYILNRRVPLGISGLVVDLDLKDVKEDSKKLSLIKDSSYKWYVNLAAKHGFFVDKNAPWRMVANISSEVMQDYMRRFGLKKEKNTATELFEGYYVQAHLDDLRCLEAFCYGVYNDLVESFPHMMKPVLCRPHKYSKVFYTKQSMTKRVPLPNQLPVRSAKYDLKYWIKHLVEIKFIEFGIECDPPLLNRISKKAFELYQQDTLEDCLDYINLEFKKRYTGFSFHQNNSLDTSAPIMLKDIFQDKKEKEDRRDDYTAY